MPIAIHNVSGEVFYDSVYVGSVFIDSIDLFGDNSTEYVICNPHIEVRMSKTSLKLGDFINGFIHGNWSTKTDFIGSIDLKFLSRYYPNVPIKIGGDVLSGASSSALPMDSLSDLYHITNITYLGGRYKSGSRVYVLLVDVEIINHLSAPIRMYDMDLDVSLDSILYPGVFANIKLEKPVTIGSKGIGQTRVRVSLYDNDALSFYLNRTIRGLPANIIVRGKLDLDIGGLHVNTTEYQTKIASSMMSAVSSAAQIQYSMFYRSLEIVNITEHSEWIEIYVKVNTSIPIPLTIHRMKVWVGLNKDTTEYPAMLEVVDRLMGPGENQALLRIVLYNTSEEFERFVKEYVYGDLESLYIDLAMDIELFGRRFEGIQLFDVLISSSEDEAQSALSVLKFDNRFAGITEFRYNGRTIVDGIEAYNLTLVLRFNNLYGITLAFGDATTVSYTHLTLPTTERV